MKTCATCGKPIPDHRKFCSSACFGMSRRLPVEMVEAKAKARYARWIADHPDGNLLKEARPCQMCGQDFRPVNNPVGRRQRFCSQRCYGDFRRVPDHLRTGREFVRRPGHPLATKNGHILRYRVVLYDAIGPGPHPCHWCGRPVDWVVRKGSGQGRDALAVDHLDGNERNDVLDNLVASCNECNALRGFMSGWEARTGLPIDVLKHQGSV